MTSIRIRPRFKGAYNLSMEEVANLVREHLKEPDCPVIAKIIPGFITIHIKPKEQHFWSPQLALSFEKDEESDRTIIRGLYGPNPTIWVIFTFGYAAISILSLFIGFYGLSQWALGQECKILWAMPFLGLAAVVLYIIAQFGQKLGVEQTFTLHHFFERSIGTRIHIE